MRQPFFINDENRQQIGKQARGSDSFHHGFAVPLACSIVALLRYACIARFASFLRFASPATGGVKLRNLLKREASERSAPGIGPADRYIKRLLALPGMLQSDAHTGLFFHGVNKDQEYSGYASYLSPWRRPRRCCYPFFKIIRWIMIPPKRICPHRGFCAVRADVFVKAITVPVSFLHP